MTNYNSIATFGNMSFGLSDVKEQTKPSTLKSTLGKKITQRDIPLRDKIDTVLDVTGIITGLSRTSLQTEAEAIQVDRAALITLDDGSYHAWDDGKHSDNYVIVSASLNWNDSAEIIQGQPNKFTMQIITWTGE